eukprot:810222-Amphidinium_carterae.3
MAGVNTPPRPPLARRSCRALLGCARQEVQLRQDGLSEVRPPCSIGACQLRCVKRRRFKRCGLSLGCECSRREKLFAVLRALWPVPWQVFDHSSPSEARCYARLHARAVNCRKKKCGHCLQLLGQNKLAGKLL